MTVGLIDFVDDHDRLEAEFDGLLGYKTGLGHRALEGIHHQEHTVGHIEHALHLAAEVAVARSVDHIDLHAFVAN